MFLSHAYLVVLIRTFN
uniref:Uncharacterized protein n=1 Tax=Arundo donax TaxID=35708 RepID=A0A0A9C6J2_ARUDO